MLPRQNFGRRHQRRLPAGLDHGRGRQQRDHGFARADVAVQEPQHAMRLRQIGDDVADRALLRRRQRVGQRRDHALAQAPLGGAAMSGPLPHMRAQQGERELAGEQFVVSEPRPRRACRIERVGLLGAMDCAQRAGEVRIAVAREPGRVLPLRQLRNAFERGIDRLAHLVRVQPLGQRIDRVDQRQPGKAFGIDNTVGMQHLQMAVVERRGARHVAQLALGQELFQIILARVEIGDGQRVGVVEGVDVVGRARPVRRRRPVALDGDGDGDDRVRPHLAELRLVAPVDEAGRQVKQQIDDARRLAVTPQEPRKQLLQLRPDAGQGGEGCEKRIEHVRPHRIPLTFYAPFSIYPSPGRVRAFGVFSEPP